MAVRTLESDQIDRWLWIISATLADLRDLAPDWESEHVIVRASWDYEWPDALHRFERLWEIYRSGGMNEDQQRRTLALQHALEESTPMIERLGLQRPPVLSST